ncbi:hypothetical protein MKW94_007445 [Papaver nudicaule]|uniref:3'-5' exonuclease domain-containing protein n=1 Tax=Papaver nudicaule TaxID=74823 RepID=A0AA41SKC8_PAPNU|nr:hypothetical protein [Papaver nudicaule]
MHINTHALLTVSPHLSLRIHSIDFLPELSVGGAKKPSYDQMSSNSSTNGSSHNNGGDCKTSIELADGSSDVYNVYYTTNNKQHKIVTTVTNNSEVVTDWINKEVYTKFRNKLNNLVVGLDIEWKRARDSSTRNIVSVLQLCFSTRCLIFQIGCCDEIPQSLVDFLGNNKFIFVGAGVDGDAHKLLADHEVLVARTEELGSLAAFKLTKTWKEYRECKYYQSGLKALAKEVLNWELPKDRRTQMSDWGGAYLTEYQIEYACLDAFVSFKLAIDLMARVSPVHTSDKEKRPFWKDFNKKDKEAEDAKPEEANQVSDKTKGSKTNNGTKSSKRV